MRTKLLLGRGRTMKARSPAMFSVEELLSKKTLLLLTVIGTAGIAGCKAKDPLACDSHADCAPESYCYSHVCIISKCTDDSDCPGRKCVNSQCIEGDVPGKCAENNGGCREKICDDSSGEVICKQGTFTVTVDKTGNGSGTVTSQPEGIACGEECSKDFVGGEQITLTAQADSNSNFVGWEGGGCAGKESSCVVSVDQAQTVSVSFTQKDVALALTVNKTGNGSGTVTSQPEGIACGEECSKDFVGGEQITLTAQADSNSNFAGWEGGGCAGKEPSCAVLLDQAKTVFASFTRKNVALTVTKTGSGTVTSTPSGINCGTACSTTYSFGSSVSLIANPAANYVFGGWGGSCSGTGSCKLTMNTPRTVSAGFTCVPETDDELCGSTCGSKADRCGKPRTCGCPYPQVCGGGSVANKCACANVIHQETLLTNWLLIPLSPPDSAYQELGNGVVLDTQTCLRWKKDYQKEGETIMFTWEKAKSICNNLGDGWRLPTITELQSLVNYQKGLPTINPVFYMPADEYPWFWSSTEYAGDSGSAWNVRFNDGDSYWNNQTYNHFVRCVR